MSGLEDCRQFNVPVAGVAPGKSLFECIPPPDMNMLNDANSRASARLTFVTLMSTFMAIVAVVIVLYLLYIANPVEGLDAIARYDGGAQIGLVPGSDIVLNEGLRSKGLRSEGLSAIRRDSAGSQRGITPFTINGLLRGYY